jgi:hypothetical protein
MALSGVLPVRERLHTLLARAAIKIGRRHRLLRVIREQEAADVVGRLGLTVRHGPCAGLKLLPEASWGRSDLPAKVLGTYEQPLHDFIRRNGPFERAVCIGAADGYYGVGLVVSGLAKSALCFEMSERGREVIAATAALNGVGDRVAVEGKADAQTLAGCLSMLPARGALFIVDIEGAEYDLLTADVLFGLAGHHVLIELHPHLVPNGLAAQQRLIGDATPHFQVAIVRDHGRELPDIPELAHLSDDQRCIICSEARETQMEWLLLSPRPVAH